MITYFYYYLINSKSTSNLLGIDLDQNTQIRSEFARNLLGKGSDHI